MNIQLSPTVSPATAPLRLPALDTTAPTAPLRDALGTLNDITLRRGAKGAAVKELQTLLQRHGIAVTADGDFGGRTEAAVQQFQREKNLRADGIVGAATWSALRGNTAAAPTLPQPAATTAPQPAAPTPSQSAAQQQRSPIQRTGEDVREIIRQTGETQREVQRQQEQPQQHAQQPESDVATVARYIAPVIIGSAGGYITQRLQDAPKKTWLSITVGGVATLLTFMAVNVMFPYNDGTNTTTR